MEVEVNKNLKKEIQTFFLIRERKNRYVTYTFFTVVFQTLVTLEDNREVPKILP